MLRAGHAACGLASESPRQPPVRLWSLAVASGISMSTGKAAAAEAA
jgi:hypothetical protein